MLEVNRSPELKSIAVDLFDYLTQTHIERTGFNLYDHKFGSLIANEIFAMTKTDEVFSALYSFSLDETLPLKKHYQDLLEKTEKEYREYGNDKKPLEFINAISSLQVVLGDLCFYDDELEEAGIYYKNAVYALRSIEQEKMNLDQLYIYVRNMLKLGIIYEKRKQNDAAFMIYGELCKRIIHERHISHKYLEEKIGVAAREEEKGSEKLIFIKSSTDANYPKDKIYSDSVAFPPLDEKGRENEEKTKEYATAQPLSFKHLSPNTNDILFKKMSYEGLKLFYLPFIAKLQIIEKSHVGGITLNHLEQTEREFRFLTSIIDHEEANILEAEFFSRIADILYYKNFDLKCLKGKHLNDYSHKNEKNNKDKKKTENAEHVSCTVCYYYYKALRLLLKKRNKETISVSDLFQECVEQTNDNCNVKFCTTLARILSDWGNVFFSCDKIKKKQKQKKSNLNDDDTSCYFYNRNTTNLSDLSKALLKEQKDNIETILDYISSESEEENRNGIKEIFCDDDNKRSYLSKFDVAFAMYAISLQAYRKANLYKRSAYQIHKILYLFRAYKIYNPIKWEDGLETCVKELSRKALYYLLYSADSVNVLELLKRKKDFDIDTIEKKIPLKNLLVDTEITRIRILVKELELGANLTPKTIRDFYKMQITSPYEVDYCAIARIMKLRMKAIVNFNAYKMLVGDCYNEHDLDKEIKTFLRRKKFNAEAEEIFIDYFDLDKKNINIDIFEKIIAEAIFCLKKITRLLKTMGDTHLFDHRFIGKIHSWTSFWVRRYEIYKELPLKEIGKKEIDEKLKKLLGEGWQEELSGYYEDQQALSHYYKSLEMHNEGKTYHNTISKMCYLEDDFNDRCDHFNIAVERHNILNKKIEKKIEDLKTLYSTSRLHDIENYFWKQ